MNDIFCLVLRFRPTGVFLKSFDFQSIHQVINTKLYTAKYFQDEETRQKLLEAKKKEITKSGAGAARPKSRILNNSDSSRYVYTTHSIKYEFINVALFLPLTYDNKRRLTPPLQQQRSRLE